MVEYPENTGWSYCRTCGKENRFWRSKPHCSSACEMMIKVAPSTLEICEDIERMNESIRIVRKCIYKTKKALWETIRKIIFERYGKVCLKCGATTQIQVDHIKPKSKFPELTYDINNLQPLCWPCNKQKTNRYIADYRLQNVEAEHERAKPYCSTDWFYKAHNYRALRMRSE